MTALSANAPVQRAIGDLNELPVAASATIYEGSMCTKNSSGYVNVLAVSERFAGHAFAKVDNSSGLDGAKKVKLYKGKYCLEVTLSGVAVTDVGKNVYATDDATLSLTRTDGVFVGKVARYVTTNTCVVEFDALGVTEPFVPELDCQTGVDTAEHVILPAEANKFGIIIKEFYGVISEVFGGTVEDQGVITLYDDDDNALYTLTPSNAGADALSDIVVGFMGQAQSTGAALKTVAAGKGLYVKVTTATSGTGAAGKMKCHVAVDHLA